MTLIIFLINVISKLRSFLGLLNAGRLYSLVTPVARVTKILSKHKHYLGEAEVNAYFHIC